MRLIIDIPKEFEQDYKKDYFADALERLAEDAHLLAGNYEKETANMLKNAFKNADAKHDCLSCSHSMSADEDGEQILVCSKQNYKRVDEEDCCWEYL